MSHELNIADLRDKAEIIQRHLSSIAHDLRFMSIDLEEADMEDLYDLTDDAEYQVSLAFQNLTKFLNQFELEEINV